MRLCLFREKLNREIKELEALIEGDRILSEHIQPTIYCIAALLRKILERLPKLYDKIENVNVIEAPHENKWQAAAPKNIKLRDLLNAIIHYVDFRPSLHTPLLTQSSGYLQTRYITILSDWDTEKLSLREIAIADFIMVAKRIAEDNKLIIDCVLSRATELLGEVIDSNSDEGFLEMSTTDILMDFFDITSKIKEDNWLDSKITISRRESRSPEFIEEIEYRVLLQKLVHENFSLFRQFQPYQEHGKVLKLVGEKSDREDNRLERIMIRAKDLLYALRVMECQRR